MRRAKPEVPPSVLRRLTKYLAHTQSLRTRGVAWVSSQEMAEALGLTSSTVRQDLTHVDFSGISKRGYEAEGLCRVLVKELGADEVWQTVVVGAGNLGAALALHEDFGRHGFCICGVFDVDAKKIGRRLGRLAVQSLRDLPAVIGEKKVDVGIIAVPSQAAQSVADLMIASGIRGLLNLTLTHIVAPKRVAVVDARIVASLQELAHAIKMKRGG